jgi:hypothetical protein
MRIRTATNVIPFLRIGILLSDSGWPVGVFTRTLLKCGFRDMPGREKSNRQAGHLHFLRFCAFAQLSAGFSIPLFSIGKTIGRSPCSCQSPIITGITGENDRAGLVAFEAG